MRRVGPAVVALAVLAGVAPGAAAWSRATFGDVAFDNANWRFVESLAASGVTQGCSAGPFARYCPARSVTRAEMAVFLVRGVHGATYVPPPASGTRFADVPATMASAPYIEQLAADGVTTGCDATRYCPGAVVRRAQMAIFLLRAKHGASYLPPAATGTMFSDVPATLSGAAFIEQLAREGITAGCDATRYCPASPVNRSQMAVFLVRTFDLPLVAAPTTPVLGPCLVQPEDNIWNARVDTLPIHPQSAAYLDTIGLGMGFHADFGSGTWNGGPIGIPTVMVWGDQVPVAVTFDEPDESDAGPYPIPPDAPIEGGPASTGDRHVLVLDRDRCTLYETYDSWPQAGGAWTAYSGAVYQLTSNALRPAGWTSADAAGLPILPGLVRRQEVAAGAIRHAIRFTAALTQRAWVWPARHFASSSTDPVRPPMGQRFRLKASFDVSTFSPDVQVILVAMKQYGIILADNGSNWYISGVPDEGWDNDVLQELSGVHGHDMEAVDASGLMVDADSGAVATP